MFVQVTAKNVGGVFLRHSVVLNILSFSVADTRMRRSSQWTLVALDIHTVIDVTLYVIHKFAFTLVACSTFNFNEKVALSAGFNTIY